MTSYGILHYVTITIDNDQPWSTEYLDTQKCFDTRKESLTTQHNAKRSVSKYF